MAYGCKMLRVHSGASEVFFSAARGRQKGIFQRQARPKEELSRYEVGLYPYIAEHPLLNFAKHIAGDERRRNTNNCNTHNTADIRYIYTSGTHAQAHTRLKIASEQHRMMEVGVGGGGGGGRCEERVEVEMEMGDGK